MAAAAAAAADQPGTHNWLQLALALTAPDAPEPSLRMCPLQRYHFSWLENHHPLRDVLSLVPPGEERELFDSMTGHHVACKCGAEYNSSNFMDRQIALLAQHPCVPCKRNDLEAEAETDRVVCKFVLQPEAVEWLVSAVAWARRALPKVEAKKRPDAQVVKLANFGVMGVGKSSCANLLLGTAIPEGHGRMVAGLEGDMMRQLTGLWTTAGGRVFETHLLDTQGIGHDGNRNQELYKKLNERYSNGAEINAILLFVHGGDRFPDALLDGITEYYKIFGEALERNLAIVFTHCKLPVDDDDVPLDEKKAMLSENVQTEFKKKKLPLPKEIFLVDTMSDIHEGKLTLPSKQSKVSIHLERVQTTFAEVDRLLTWAGQLPPISTLEFHRRSKQEQKHAEIFSNHLEGRLDVTYRVFPMENGIKFATGHCDGLKSFWKLAWTYNVAEVHLVSTNDLLKMKMRKYADHVNQRTLRHFLRSMSLPYRAHELEGPNPAHYWMQPKVGHLLFVSAREEVGQLAEKWEDNGGKYSGSYKAVVVEVDIFH